MKTIFFILACITVSCVQSQLYYNYPYEFELGNIQNHYFSGSEYTGSINLFKSQKEMKKFMVRQVNEINIYYDKKNRKKEYTTELKYNKLGRLLEVKSKDWHKKNEYQNDSLMTYSSTLSKKKLSETKMTYEDARCTSVTEFRKGKEAYSRNYEYRHDGKISRTSWKRKNYTGEMKYTYTENNKIARTELYRNGKLKNVWNYECKPEGQVLASLKQESLSSTCKYNEESSDGSYIIFTRSIKKGIPYLLKQSFTKDSLKISSNYYVKDSVLLSSNTYNLETNSWTNNSYRKNKLISQEIIIQDDQERIISLVLYARRKMKLSYSYKNEYDTEGRIINNEYTSGRKKHGVSKTLSFYDSKGLLEKTQQFYNGKLNHEQKLSFLYF